jgi:uncharacterized protein (DUF58 family)
MSNLTHPDAIATTAFPGWSPAFEAALSRLSIFTRRPAGSPFPGEVRSAARGRAIEFADYRPYISGDEPALVDWRVYARTGRLYVKRHLEERERSLTLLIDASASLDFGDGEAHKGTYARRLAAALAWISLAHHEPVRVWLLRDGNARALPPAIGYGDATALFRGLAAVREAGSTALAGSIGVALTQPQRGPVLLISDLLEPGWADALRVLGRYEAAVLQTLAPEEWEPALGEEVELEDGETGERLATRLGPVEVAAYGERLSAFLAGAGRESRRDGLLHIALNTGAPLAETVLRRLPAAGVIVT